MERSSDMKKTLLYDQHIASGGKMISFGGWVLPVQYRGILEEHRAVRENVGLFDVSHMGKIIVRGSQAESLIQGLITNDISEMKDGQVIYSLLCNHVGGVLDDLLVYRLSVNDFMLVVNAVSTAKDLYWIKERTKDTVEVADYTGSIATMSLQGPQSVKLLCSLTSFDVGSMRRYQFIRCDLAGIKCLVSRTGYTGEDGFELYPEAVDGLKMWQILMTSGQEYGLVPVGLGARDTLRIEASLPLYGNELSEETNPLDAGLDRFIKLEKAEFIGRLALRKYKQDGPQRRLVGLSMTDRGIPRSHYPVLMDGEVIGTVTSGTFAPSLNACLAMAYVPSWVNTGDQVFVRIRGKNCSARVVPMPFYKRRK